MESINTNTEFNELNELDDLRQQINALKNKVDQQGRLNESLVKKAIQSKMKSVHGIIIKLAIVAIACVPFYILMKYQVGLSWPLTIATIVMMLGSVTSDYFINRIDVSHMGDDLVETANKLVKMKRNRVIGQRIGISAVLLWLIWFCYEYFAINSAYGSAVAWGGIVGIVLVKQVDAFHQRLGLAGLLLAVNRDARVECHLVDPSLEVTLSLERLKPLPQLDERFLEEVIDFFLVLGEHVAHGVNCALVLADDACKVGFVQFHCSSIIVLTLRRNTKLNNYTIS